LFVLFILALTLDTNSHSTFITSSHRPPLPSKLLRNPLPIIKQSWANLDLTPPPKTRRTPRTNVHDLHSTKILGISTEAELGISRGFRPPSYRKRCQMQYQRMPRGILALQGKIRSFNAPTVAGLLSSSLSVPQMCGLLRAWDHRRTGRPSQNGSYRSVHHVHVLQVPRLQTCASSSGWSAFL